MDLFFSNSSSGLGLRQVRYNIGGGESYINGHFLRAGARAASFLEADGRWNWQADQPQRRVLQAALERGVTHTMAFANSPPVFMTVSGSVTGAPGGANNLRDDQYDAFASYLATVVKHFQTQSKPVYFDAVTPLNEPVARWWKYGNGQEGCHFDRDKQSDIVAKLGAALRNVTVKGVTVAGPEENSLDDTIASLQAYSPEALAELGLVTSHTYHGVHRTELSELVDKLGKRMWNSEYGDGGGALQGGIALAQRIIQDLNYLNISVWTLWQTLDLATAPLPTSGWGLLSGSYHEENLYHLRLGGPDGPCLTAADLSNGANLSVVECQAVASQVFSIVDTQIKAVNSTGKCLDAWGQAMQPGDRVALYDCWNGNNQHWYPSDADRNIRLSNKTGLCMQAAQNSSVVTVDLCASKQGNDALTTTWYIQSVTDGVTLRNGSSARYTDSTKEEYLIRDQFWSFKQFTSFIQPGDTILATNDTSNTTVLARKPNGDLVVVVVNSDPSSSGKQAWQFDLSDYQTAGCQVEWYMTDADHHCQQMPSISVPSSGILTVTVSPSSIATYVISTRCSSH
eukprot:TRINITY_DN9106_c0_g1_i3.p1 TRINITY_DN9106_c0_g1~~TRINITY_DN9106_c0_g1_i3.p1  ORF type:complete len:626 (+),score=124.77 TRINITY_DN9106_c0_g1_i3:176-1879(+)